MVPPFDNKVRGAQTSFVLPPNFPMFPLRPNDILNLEHPAYPADEGRRKEYLISLKALMEQVPSLLNTDDTTQPQENMPSLHVSRIPTIAFRPELKLIPELESYTRPLKEENNLEAQALSGEAPVIFSFAMYNIQTKALEQQIEVLGNQSLSDLCDHLYCVQHKLFIANQAEANDENKNASQQDRAFFYLEQGFYVDACRSETTNSNSTIVNDLRKWIQLQQDFFREQEEAERAEQLHKEEKAKVQSTFPPGSFLAIAAAWQSAQLQKIGGSQPVQRAGAAAGAEPPTKDDRKNATKRGRKPVDPPDMDVIPIASKEEIMSLHTEVQVMKMTAIQECSLVMGKPYLFCHAGHCEHVIILLDRRSYVSAADGSWTSFPKELFCYITGSVSGKKAKRRTCQVCEVSTATVITMHDRLAVSSPCFFCQSCYEMLHYGPDGELLYDDFVEIPYMHDTV